MIMKKTFFPHQQESAQKGVVLIVGLILLVAISLTAMYTLRRTLTGEQTSKNINSHAVAMQSAETALRICENAVRANVATLGTGANQVNLIINSMPETLASGQMPTRWLTRANWVATNPRVATQIPAALIGNNLIRPLLSPRCMVEQYELPIMGEDKMLSQPYLVTVIGYSADYQNDGNGNAIAGSEVWLQSVLRP